MGSFGDRLRREREQRGITLDDVALTTKIRAGLLKALEEEKFEQLPGGIFNKGFVRAYARHLGIDEDQAVADYLVASGEAPIARRVSDSGTIRVESAEPRIQLVSEEKEERPPSSTPSGMRAGLLLLLVVGVAAWIYYHYERRSEPSQEGASSVAQVGKPSAPTASNPTAVPSQASPTPNQSGSSPSSVMSEAANPAQGTFTVRFQADEECWMKITADGKTEEVTLPAGGEKSVTAKDKILVRVGNIGALNVSFEGKRLPSQGEYGEVKTLSFGSNGLEASQPSSLSQTAPAIPAEAHP